MKDKLIELIAVLHKWATDAGEKYPALKLAVVSLIIALAAAYAVKKFIL